MEIVHPPIFELLNIYAGRITLAKNLWDFVRVWASNVSEVIGGPGSVGPRMLETRASIDVLARGVEIKLTLVDLCLSFILWTD